MVGCKNAKHDSRIDLGMGHESKVKKFNKETKKRRGEKTLQLSVCQWLSLGDLCLPVAHGMPVLF